MLRKGIVLVVGFIYGIIPLIIGGLSIYSYDVYVRHLCMEPEIVEDFIEAMFMGNWIV